MIMDFGGKGGCGGLKLPWRGRQQGLFITQPTTYMFTRTVQVWNIRQNYVDT